MGTDRTTRALIGLAVGSLGALGAAAALVGVRGEIANANGAVGLVVGEIAVRSQTIHALRTDHRAQLRRINRIAGLAAKGELVDDLLLAVTAELIDTLRLRDAYFERPPYLAGFPRLERNGVVGTRVHRYADGEFELPREGVELPVGAGEALLGRFVLVPTPGVGVSTERRLIAIALADQVGAVLGRKAA